VVSQGAAKILVSAKYLYLALLTSQSLRFVYVLILARMLGAELYGLFSYGQSWYLMFLPLTGLGVGQCSRWKSVRTEKMLNLLSI
jgi:O-antigen/teichoic acid export membrane protein